ncbi:lactonase family protein [Sphingomonas sp. AOB5]|uniref:lactonase family protein n=1 Tax=Sphingomonas sp. AOB5 TaxID=3034017 RepID=UPI0023FA3627|nr:lactonase family protein [Sphingomonas sp. AOB5]MDF7775293.1 lactonase family protein [Sphingomonas sp. AOB5]
MSLSRRSFAAGLAHAALAAPAAFAQTAPGRIVYIGTQASEPGQGIFAARLDTRAGKLIPIGVAFESKRPTWVEAHPDRPLLYTVVEAGNESGGELIALASAPGTGALRLLNRVPSGGGGPTHLALDTRSNTLFAAHYGSGHVSAVPIGPDGSLAPPASMAQNQGTGPHRRQAGPHAHAVLLDPSRRFVLSADLGADKIFVYRFDPASRALTPADPPSEAVTPGHGPRHLAFRPDGKFLYLITELVPEVHAYRWNAGRLVPVQTVPIAIDEAKRATSSGAEIATSSDGRFLYVSIRGEDVILAYAVDKRTGALTEIQRIGSGGQRPWSFAIDPSGRWMLVANQTSSNVALFARDPRTGKLRDTGSSIAVPKPTSFAFPR